MKVLYLIRHLDVEGRSATTVGAMADRQAAEQLAQAHYGNWAGEATELLLFESAADFDAWQAGAVKRAALAKLSPAEREALGHPSDAG